MEVKEVTFMVIARSTDLQLAWNDDRYATRVLIFYLICHLILAMSSEVTFSVIARSNDRQIDLKCWQVNYWSPYLSFDISLDIGYEKFIQQKIQIRDRSKKRDKTKMHKMSTCLIYNKISVNNHYVAFYFFIKVLLIV